MDSRDYANCDAVELGSRIREGELSAQDALAQAYRVIEMLDPKINAFVSLEKDLATQTAKAPVAGPFMGVPMAMKDCVDFVRGAPRRFGSRLTNEFRSEHDDEVIARLKAAGLNPIGTTNVPEFSSSLTTESVLHGPCRNPWDLRLSVGGSSGGSAAAVAYGAVPIAYGNDSAGSIRIPASCCGVFGFRPSRGRVPMGPLFGEIWHGLFAHHVITRSVRDSAVALDATQGIDVGAPYGAPAPVRPFSEDCTTSPGRLRIAMMDGSAQGIELSDDCAEALDSTAAVLRANGHDVRPAAPEYNSAQLGAHVATLLAVALADEVPGLAKESGRPISSDTVEACHRALIERGRSIGALELSSALNYRHILARAMGSFLANYDVLLCPTLARPPWPLGTFHPDMSDVEAYLETMRGISPFAILANFAGLPSMSVPLCWSPAGLPIGMMFTGRYADESTLFRLAGELETRHPWRDRHPPLSAWSTANE